ncbi:iron-containing redox enzyme family protein [Catenulispora sp. NL8]|uniref:Iron-containing redox enzyme family protein n=1 Tax=Catenulispora pinistramenti TaxID=2705254 RepID=A0ABS5KL76_9ACTN|nr:iron-containing redox enzyme family protein [Catenulispora pinistramenti]MBS2546797.1 iron-containing redox enzyme family protein [Catenulispora pinistramenti]
MPKNAMSVGVRASAASTPGDGGGSAFRRIYARVADPEAFVPAGELVDVVRAEVSRSAFGGEQQLDTLVRQAADWSASSAEHFAALGKNADSEGRRLLARRAALGWAPLGLASGAWLQWLTSPGSGDDPLFLRALALYASDIGVGHPGAARGSAYLGLLRQLRLSENAVPLARLATDPRISDEAFRLPALLLVMSRRPGDFCAELIGADLCLRAVAFPPPLVLVGPEARADWEAIDYSGTRGDGPSPTAQCAAIADALIQAGPESQDRVYAGFAWALSALRGQAEALHDELSAALDPAYDMAQLMMLRAREGSVYHGQVMLEERPVAAWLKDCLRDPYPFLEVLARSRLIKPGRSGISPLINSLVGERGPMFRVFSPDDLGIISRWIDSLGAETGPGRAARDGEPTGSRPVPGRAAEPDRLARLPYLLTSAPVTGTGPRDLREAYHLLMMRTASADLRDWSLRYVMGWLGRTRHRMGPESVSLPQRWKPEGLRPWLQAQHDGHAEQFALSAETELPSRQAVVDDAVQTAPLTLIDGSWLQGFTDYELASSGIGHSLFETYWDELGNGEPKLNHPLIYREVLKGMDVDLPPTASREFAGWPGFRDTSFELPVYWLCIGRFPRTFLPEVLGLNLAMELSGVGGTYRRAAMALREYGFDTRFVDIHNTIDNVATGHSAWATDAVDTLMAGLPDSSGPDGRSEVWERVRSGYRSLNPPRGFLARRAGHRAERRWRHTKAVTSAGEEYFGV